LTERNVLCPRYRECLDAAAKGGSTEWQCDGCAWQEVYSNISGEEISRCILLIWAVCWPHLWKRYQEVKRRLDLEGATEAEQ
jgi:hypothetical protein